MDIVISQPLPAGTVLTLDGLDRDANPVPLRREELDEPTDRVTLSDVPADYPVLSLIVEPGDGSAFAPDQPFFKIGATYTENRPFAAPEARRVFKVAATDRHPSKGYLIAFGYEQGQSGRWHRASLDQDDWDRGWVELPPPSEDSVEADPS